MVRHLSTLSILHYVYGGLTCVMGLFMFAIVGMGLFLQSELVQQSDDPAPAILGGVFQVFGWVMFAFMELIGVLIMLSGRWISLRQNRTVSLILAGLCCLSFPLGTALGVFTFIVLLNQEVQQEYDGSRVRVAA